jgi:hypothetical protein
MKAKCKFFLKIVLKEIDDNNDAIHGGVGSDGKLT